MPNEVELKLRIAPTDAASLRHIPAVTVATVGKPVTRKLVSIYYDTPDLQLLDAGVSLRVRRMSGGWFQAVKGKGVALAGLHQRMEWEDAIATGHPDFSKLTDPALTGIFDNKPLRAALAPIFLTEVKRTEWQLSMPDGSHIEMALDMGKLEAHGKSEPINEVELELKHGHPARLFELALELQSQVPLHIENVSKAQRGYGYYRPTPPLVIKAKMPVLKSNMRADEAFRHIGWECLTQLQGNQNMMLHGSDPEGVHQMRVALRRLRSAIGLFRTVIDVPVQAGVIEELRWITGMMGATRDLDVFLGETLPVMITQLDSHPGLLALRDKAVAEQEEACAKARAAIQSQRYQRLLLTLGVLLESEPAGAAPCSVVEIAETMLRKRNKQLRRHGRLLQEASAEERHLARIASKKLRYAAEFFACLYPHDKSQPFLQHLENLQNVLGTLNDIASTRSLLLRLAGSQPTKALDEALHIFSGWNGCHAMHNLTHMDNVWRTFASQKEFWH